MSKKAVCGLIIVLIIIPVVLIMGYLLYGDRSFAFCSVIVAALSCVPFFLSFESSAPHTRRVVMLAVFIALTVAGRFIFAPLQFFKPVTAMVVIAGMYFGSEFGFLAGSLSALVSNFYFGQGPWTPFQMFSWGIIGFFAGIMSNPLLRHRLLLLLYGAVSGVVFSLIMDVWTALWADGTFKPDRFFALALNAAPVTGIYIVSNILFLAILTPLFDKKIQRMKVKYKM